ncbi:MAG: STAS domain-containing protein [Bacteroidaceae bacterium]|nr:STAS domain-containing protein [Bacteroidaceae bacterium]
MVISKEPNGQELIVMVVGRLDTNTAPELDSFLQENTEGIERMVLDFTKLDYISSAGLRVLLSANKKFGPENLIVRNANEIVSEVFEVTGFCDILNIK